MQRNINAVILLCAIPLCVAASQNNISVAVSTGEESFGNEHIRPYRVAAMIDFGPLWLKEREWHLHFLWDASIAHWDGVRREYGTSRDDNLTVVATGPQVRYEKKTPWSTSVYPYIELGIGFSWVSQKRFDDSHLGQHFQFEDRLGIGLRFGQNRQYDFNYRIVHYSNAGMSEQNFGLDVQMITIGYWF